MRQTITNPMKYYYSQIKKEIPLFYPNRKKILIHTKNDLQMYAKEHTDFSYGDLVEDFGAPSVVADNLVSYESPQNIRKGLFLSRQAYLFMGVLVLLMILSVITIMKFSGFFSAKANVESDNPKGYSVEQNGVAIDRTIPNETVSADSFSEETTAVVTIQEK